MNFKSAEQNCLDRIRRLRSFMRRRLLLATTVVFVFGAAYSAVAAPLRLGMMGDSITAGDGSANGEFPNWHTQLASAGRVTVGPTANQAIDGANSNDLANQQLPIVNLVQTGQLDASMLMIGAIDAVQFGYGLVLGGDPSGLPTSFSNGVAPNIAATLVAVANAGSVHQVVANIPDVAISPLVQSVVQSAGTSPLLVAQFESAIDYTNQLIAADALARGIPVLDLFRLGRDLSAHPPLTLGGVAISNLFAPDGFHPAPVMHGLFANMFIEAMNQAYGAAIEPISDQQLLQNAGYESLPGGPTYFDVRQYVMAPEPAAIMLAIVGFAPIILRRRLIFSRRSRTPRA